MGQAVRAKGRTNKRPFFFLSSTIKRCSSPHTNNQRQPTSFLATPKNNQIFIEAAPTGICSWYEERFGFEHVGSVRMEFTDGGFDLPLMLRRPRGGAPGEAAGASGGGGGDGSGGAA